MSENYNIQIGVDASQAESGVKRFDTALKNTIKSLNTFDQSASKAFQSFSSSAKSMNFSSLASQTSAFSRASAKISSDLSAASKSFTQFSKAAASAMTEVSRAASRVDFSKITAQTKAMNSALWSISTTSTKAVGAINNIAKAIGDLNSVMTGTGKRGTNALAQALAGLNGIKIDPTLTRNLRNLGNALDTIKAPSAGTIRALSALGSLGSLRIPAGVGSALAQIGSGVGAINSGSINALRALPAALAGLNSVRVSPTTVQALAGLGKSLSGITVPSGPGIALLRVLLSTLSSAKINPQTAQYVSTFAQAVGQFRGPSASAIVNTQKLLQVMSGANVANVTRIAGALRQVQTSFARTGQSSVQSGQQMNSAFSQTFPRLARLQGEMRGLENTFSLSYNAASVFRTALGSLTMGQFVKQVGEAGMAAQSFQQSMMVVSANSTELQQHLDFINNITQRLPISLEAARDSYKGFAAATLMAGISVKDTQMIFENFSGAFSVLGLSTEKTKYAFLALQQIASKGRFSMEELRRQLGEQLPGTMQILADAMSRVRGQDISVAKLEKMVETGQLGVKELIEFGKQMGIVFGPQVANSLNTPIAKMQELNTAFTKFKQKIFESGGDTGMAVAFEQLTKGLESSKMQEAAQRIGAAFKEIGIWVGALGRTALENIDVLAKFGAGIAAWGAFTGIAAMMRAIVSPIGLLGAAALAASQGSNTLAIALFALGGSSVAINLLNNSVLGLLKNLLKVGAVAAVAVESLRMLDYFAGDSIRSALENNPDLKKAYDTVIGSADFLHKQGVEVFEDIANAAKNPTKIVDELGEAFNKVMDLIKAGGDPSQALEVYKKQMDDARQSAEKLGKVGNPSDKQWEDNATRINKGRLASLQAITAEEQKLLDLVAPQIKAMEEYEAHLRAINSLREAGRQGMPKGINDDQAAALKQVLDRKYLDKVDPLKGFSRDLGEELQALQKTGDARQLEQKFIQQRNQLLEKGVVLTKEGEAALRSLNEAMMDLERGGSNGFQRYANSVKDFRESLIDVEQNAIGGLSDALADLTTKGTADFKALGQNILRTFNKALIDSLLKDMFSSFDGESPLASLFGVGKKNNAGAAKGLLDQFSSQKNMAVQTANIQAGVVNVNGSSVPGADGSLPSADPFRKGIGSDSAASKSPEALPSSATGLTPSQATAQTPFSGVPGSYPGTFGQETKPIAPSGNIYAPQADNATSFTPGSLGAFKTIKPSAPGIESGAEWVPWTDPKQDALKVRGGEMPYATIPEGDTMSLSKMPYVSMDPSNQAANAGLYGAAMKPLSEAQGVFSGAATPQAFGAMPDASTYKLTTVPTSSIPVAPPEMKYPPINPAEVDMMPTGSIAAPAAMMRGNAVDPSWLQTHLRDRIAQSKLNGYVPEDGAKYGITTGSPDEWSNMMTRLAYHESGLNVKNVGDVGHFGTGSRGLFQLSQQDGVNWKLNGGRQFSLDQLEDPTTNADAAVRISERLVTRSGSIREGMGQYWGPFKREGWTPGHGRDRSLKLGEIPKQPASEAPRIQQSAVGSSAVKVPPKPLPEVDTVGKVSPGGYRDITNSAPNAGYRDALGGDLYGGNHIAQGGGDVPDYGMTGVSPSFNVQRPPTVLSPDLPQNFGTSPMAQMQQQMMQQQAMMSNQMAQMTQPLQAASSSAMASFNQVGSSIAQAGSQASTSTGMFGSLGNSLDQMFSQLGSAFSGGGGGGGGGGLFGGLFNMFGMFQEGGVSTAPVTALAAATSFRNMPHYSEGTDLASRAPGTPSMGGGFGAVLHDNEAVIPLTRGREVPVKMAGGRGGNGGGTTVVNMTVNGVKDVGGFNRSKSQIAASMSTAMTQATQKQN